MCAIYCCRDDTYLTKSAQDITIWRLFSPPRINTVLSDTQADGPAGRRRKKRKKGKRSKKKNRKHRRRKLRGSKSLLHTLAILGTSLTNGVLTKVSMDLSSMKVSLKN